MTDKNRHQSIYCLFGVTSSKTGIVAKYNAFLGRFAWRRTPFPEDGMGNLFVIGAVTGRVKFWHHECPKGENSVTALTVVSETFEAFVPALEVVKKDHNPKLLRGIKKAIFDFLRP